MHADHFGDFAQGERLEVLHPLLEEVPLPVHDEIHHLEHGLAALLDRLNHPVGAVQLVGDELAVLRRQLLLVAGDVLIGPAEPEARHAGVVEADVVLAVDLVDDQVGDDVPVAPVGVLESGLRVEAGQVSPAACTSEGSTPNRLASSFHRWAIRSGKASDTSRYASESVSPASRSWSRRHSRRSRAPTPGRVQLLDHPEHLLQLGRV